MPERYNAASEIVLPMQDNDPLYDALERFGQLGDSMVLTTQVTGAPPGAAVVGGMEFGLELALADPAAARKILVHIDSAKAAAHSRESALANATGRTEKVQALIDATNGVSINYTPPDTKFRWN